MRETAPVPDDPHRRLVLKLAALGGAAAGVPTLALGTHRRSDREEVGEAAVLGDFESGLDGWSTNGGNTLERISEEDIPAGIRSGSHGLSVEIDGDAYPMIENKQRVAGADFLEFPHLSMHVLGATADTESDLMFQFRIHHLPDNGGALLEAAAVGRMASRSTSSSPSGSASSS